MFLDLGSISYKNICVKHNPRLGRQDFLKAGRSSYISGGHVSNNKCSSHL